MMFKKITLKITPIFTDQDGCLATNLFCKETAGNTLLHAASACPPGLIRSIPYVQYRLRRNCTYLTDFKFN